MTERNHAPQQETRTRTSLRIGIALLVPLIIIGLIVWHRNPPRPVQLGQPAPSFTLRDLQGHHYAFKSSLSPQITVINFFTTWCTPCQAEAPDLAAVINSQQGKVKLLMIDRLESRSLVAPFVAKYGLGRAVILLDRNDQLAAPFGVTGQPETFILNHHGIVQAHLIGPVSQAVLLSYIQQFAKSPQ